jgi:hypothetical protein
MPTTPLGLVYPASGEHTRVWEHLQTLAVGVDGLLTLPNEANSGSGTGTNLITAGAAVWASLPAPTSVAMANPSLTRGLLCQVSYGAWLIANGSAVRVCVGATGGLTIAGGPGNGGAVNWGEILFLSNQSANLTWQFAAAYTCTLPANTTTTFEVLAYRDLAAGTENVNYPTLRVTPLRYV